MNAEFLLAHLRCARARAQLAVVEIDAIGIALKGGFIGSGEAWQWLGDVDCLKYLDDPPDDRATSGGSPTPP
jgi:hypothetical protein